MNPFNTVSLYGTLLNDPTFLTYEGKEFACRFRVAVRRNFRNRQGNYDIDSILVKYRFESSEFAHGLKKGDIVLISGSIVSERTNNHYLSYVDTRDVSYDEGTIKNCYGAGSDGSMTEEPVAQSQAVIDLPLPF